MQQIEVVSNSANNTAESNLPNQKNLLNSDENAIEKSEELLTTANFHGVTIILMKDVNDKAQRIEVLSLNIIDMLLQVKTKNEFSNINMNIGDLQVDNQMFEYGGFDFPVVLLSQKPFMKSKTDNNLFKNSNFDFKDYVENSLIAVEVLLEEHNKEKGNNKWQILYYSFRENTLNVPKRINC